MDEGGVWWIGEDGGGGRGGWRDDQNSCGGVDGVEMGGGVVDMTLRMEYEKY